MNEVRIVVILILLVFALIGHRKGITGEIASLVSVALSILGIALIVRVVGSYMKHNMSDIVQAVIIFVMLAFLSQIFNFLFKSLKILAKLPVIHGLDSLGGMLIGMVEGILIVWILFIVIARYDVLGKSEEWLGMIANDPYLSKLSAINPFTHFF